MKFIYLADTHIGGSDSEGYYKQPRYLRYFQQIIKCLKDYIENTGDIDFIIHGGDMVDETTPESIKAAADFFDQLPCPTYLVLGNHDLTEPDSVAMWLKQAPQLFTNGATDFRLIKDGVQLDALLCNWGKTSAYWNPEEPQIPWLSEKQLQQIADLDHDCYRQIIVTHSPVYGLPPEQHGGTEPLHPPAGNLQARLSPVLNNTSLVLGAHNHMNMALLKDNRYYVTTAALSEMPFEFKIIEVTRQKLAMQTIDLSALVPFHGKYDFNATYVQGRTCDRKIEN
jgi:3',5'-cyclic-AMP phosphodiesterase